MTHEEKKILQELCEIINSVIGSQAREMGITWCSTQMNRVNEIKNKLDKIKTKHPLENFNPKNYKPLP